MQLHDFLTHNYMIYCTQITLNQRYTISDPRLNLPYVPTSTHIQVRIWKCVSLVQCYSSVNHFRSFIQFALGTFNTANRAGCVLDSVASTQEKLDKGSEMVHILFSVICLRGNKILINYIITFLTN